MLAADRYRSVALPFVRPRRPASWTRVAAIAALAIFVVLGLAGPALAGGDVRVPVGRPFQPPSGVARLGTNDVGQDTFALLLTGARTTLIAALGITVLSTGLAWAVGVASGLWRSIERPLMAVTDLLIALPAFPLALLVLALLGPSLAALIVTLGLLSWPGYARIVRASVLSIRGEPYVEAAIALGASPVRVAARHVAPGTLGLLPGKVILTVRSAVFVEASLAFLGLGDPTSKSWGGMLGAAFGDGMLFARPVWPWLVLPPALAIVAVVWATSVLALQAADRTATTT